MRGLKALVIGMGALIAVGLGVVVVTIASRIDGGDDDAALSGAFGRVTVTLPAGALIVETVAEGGRLLVRVARDGAPPRIVVIDLASGRKLGEIELPAADAAPR